MEVRTKGEVTVEHHDNMQAHGPSLQQVFPMRQGDGETSYSKNSTFQSYASRMPLLMLTEAIQKLDLASPSGPVVVADLGCSSGPNTIADVTYIVDQLREKVSKDAEFQVYFNDVASNDFNQLFHLLSTDPRAEKFCAAGVPGSFHDRLFPKSSVHVFHSGNSLHWLSKIPEAVLDQESPAYNRGKSWFAGSNPAVRRAYRLQALEDMKGFLQARAAELVPGGLLFFYTMAAPTPENNESEYDMMSNFHLKLDVVLNDLVAEGLLTEQQQDKFNIPIYPLNIDDIGEALASSGSLLKLAMTKAHRASLSEAFTTTDPKTLALKMKATVQAATGPLLEAHFGKSVQEVIWQRYEKLVVETKIGLHLDYLKILVLAFIRN